MEFTEEEVKEKLQELGYINVPRSKLQEFMRDLHDLVEDDQTSSMNTTKEESDSYYQEDNSMHRGKLFKQKPLQDISQRTQPLAFSKERISKRHVSLDKENGRVYDDTTTSDYLSSTTTSYTDSDLLGAQTKRQPHYTQRNRELQSTSVRRKVARKKNGVSLVFDETLTDNDSVTSDITMMEERLRNMPLGKEEYEFDDSSSDITSGTSRLHSHSQWDDKRPVSAIPAFIRPSTAHPHTKKLRKCDPVSRYHQFKQEWKVNKVPGESKHSALRWDVRGQMLNCEVFEKPRHRYTANNYVVPTEKKRQSLRWQVRTALAKN